MRLLNLFLKKSRVGLYYLCSSKKGASLFSLNKPPYFLQRNSYFTVLKDTNNFKNFLSNEYAINYDLQYRYYLDKRFQKFYNLVNNQMQPISFFEFIQKFKQLPIKKFFVTPSSAPVRYRKGVKYKIFNGRYFNKYFDLNGTKRNIMRRKTSFKKKHIRIGEHRLDSLIKEKFNLLYSLENSKFSAKNLFKRDSKFKYAYKNTKIHKFFDQTNFDGLLNLKQFNSLLSNSKIKSKSSYYPRLKDFSIKQKFIKNPRYRSQRTQEFKDIIYERNLFSVKRFPSYRSAKKFGHPWNITKRANQNNHIIDPFIYKQNNSRFNMYLRTQSLPAFNHRYSTHSVKQLIAPLFKHFPFSHRSKINTHDFWLDMQKKSRKYGLSPADLDYNSKTMNYLGYYNSKNRYTRGFSTEIDNNIMEDPLLKTDKILENLYRFELSERLDRVNSNLLPYLKGSYRGSRNFLYTGMRYRGVRRKNMNVRLKYLLSKDRRLNESSVSYLNNLILDQKIFEKQIKQPNHFLRFSDLDFFRERFLYLNNLNSFGLNEEFVRNQLLGKFKKRIRRVKIGSYYGELSQKYKTYQIGRPYYEKIYKQPSLLSHPDIKMFYLQYMLSKKQGGTSFFEWLGVLPNYFDYFTRFYGDDLLTNITFFRGYSGSSATLHNFLVDSNVYFGK